MRFQNASFRRLVETTARRWSGSAKTKTKSFWPAKMSVSVMPTLTGATGPFGVSRPLAGYTQEGLQGPRIATTIVAGADVRIPNFVVTRFSEQGIVFHPGYVYGSKYVDDKKTPAGTMKRASAYSLGTEYPDA